MLAPGPRPGALRAQTALRGRAGRDPACPARFPAALPRTREVSPLSPGAGSGVSCVTAVLRAPGVGRPTAAPRSPRRGNYFGESCPRRGGEGRAHGRLARLLCCHSESRVIKLRLLRAAGSGARLSRFRGRRLELCGKRMVPRCSPPGAPRRGSSQVSRGSRSWWYFGHRRFTPPSQDRVTLLWSTLPNYRSSPNRSPPNLPFRR